MKIALLASIFWEYLLQIPQFGIIDLPRFQKKIGRHGYNPNVIINKSNFVYSANTDSQPHHRASLVAVLCQLRRSTSIRSTSIRQCAKLLSSRSRFTRNRVLIDINQLRIHTEMAKSYSKMIWTSNNLRWSARWNKHVRTLQSTIGADARTSQ